MNRIAVDGRTAKTALFKLRSGYARHTIFFWSDEGDILFSFPLMDFAECRRCVSLSLCINVSVSRSCNDIKSRFGLTLLIRPFSLITLYIWLARKPQHRCLIFKDFQLKRSRASGRVFFSFFLKIELIWIKKYFLYLSIIYQFFFLYHVFTLDYHCFDSIFGQR